MMGGVPVSPRAPDGTSVRALPPPLAKGRPGAAMATEWGLASDTPTEQGMGAGHHTPMGTQTAREKHHEG